MVEEGNQIGSGKTGVGRVEGGEGTRTVAARGGDAR
jgi:hypothetical protein